MRISIGVLQGTNKNERPTGGLSARVLRVAGLTKMSCTCMLRLPSPSITKKIKLKNCIAILSELSHALEKC